MAGYSLADKILNSMGFVRIPLTGRIIWRSADFGYKHLGVIVGLDRFRNTIIAHNHPDTPLLVDGAVFSSGRKCFLRNDPVLPPDVSMQNLLIEIYSHRPYHAVNNNCQHLANRIARGVNESRGTNGTIFVVGLGLLGLLLSNQNVDRE